MKNRSVANMFALVLLLAGAAGVMAQEELPVQEAVQQPAKQPYDQVLKRITDLVIANSPELKSQFELVAEIEALPMPGDGLIDPQEYLRTVSRDSHSGIPLLTISQKEEFITLVLTRRTLLEEAKQQCETLKKTIVSSLLEKLTLVIEATNRKKNLEEFSGFLEDRVVSLEMEVRTGIAEPTELYNLMERIMETELEIGNISSTLKVLKHEIAVNFGGERWIELLELLGQFT